MKSAQDEANAPCKELSSRWLTTYKRKNARHLYGLDLFLSVYQQINCFCVGIDPFVIISMNQAVNEITAAPCDCSYPFTAQPGFGHFGHKGTATFTDYAGVSRFAFLFKTGIRLLTVFDG